MKIASDFRAIARNALRGRWGVAVIAGLIASLLGAIASNGPEVELNFRDSGASVNVAIADQQIFTSSEGWLPELNALIVGGAIYIILAAVVLAVVFFVLGSIIEVGYARFNLDLVDRQAEPDLGTLFAYFSHWKNTTMTNLLKSVYIFLWSLLLVIPGIIASYSYAMTGYLLAENPDLTAEEAMARSKEMMEGNRWRLFCLHVSFIGWSILAAMTLGIGNLWLTPYRQAATAAFYREVSGTEFMMNTAAPSGF